MKKFIQRNFSSKTIVTKIALDDIRCNFAEWLQKIIALKTGFVRPFFSKKMKLIASSGTLVKTQTKSVIIYLIVLLL